MSYRIVIEIYVLLSIINAFLFVGSGIYTSGHPTESLRSPFSGYPLGTSFTFLNSTGLQHNMTTPTNSTGGIIGWIATASDAFQSFLSQITVIINFVKFFTAGYIIDLLNSVGFPANFLYIATVPLAFYVAYMTFVMIANRLGY